MKDLKMKERLKLIHSSNLALRFYVSEGWTKAELDKYCIRGEVHMAHPDDRDPYFTLDHNKNSAFDAVMLYSKSGGLVRIFNDYPHESDIQFIERMNW